ncbi:hypothetical protein D3870_17180 [Noviherbaspirillum cavernae]|uniref:Four helix bundle protein n=1 Tax=Noviherbaspirillum cavernae TaxID=2320862 RepID=A0A418X505_9BURK|nr:hypothetical protein [Noviherbaspirillum cavernae]RJG07496.1 hypothetical protein D3870_17180 [Noviherbaspirillum cavernae]
MNIQSKFDTDMTVRSFAYVAMQLARSPAAPGPSALYEQILGEAEKHRSALRLVLRDVFEMAEQGLRRQTLTKTEFHRLRDTATQTIAQAQQAITRIATQYAPHKLAA